MQIPGIGGQSGTSIAQAPQAVGVPLLDAGRGLQQLGNAGLQIAGEEAAYQRDLNLTAQRARTALTLATTNNALHDAHEEVARGVMEGSIDPGKAAGEWQTRANKVKGANLDGVLPEQRQLIEDHLATTTGGLARSLNGVVIKRQQDDVAATIIQFKKQVGRDVMRTGPDAGAEKYDAMLDFSGKSAGFSDAHIALEKEAARKEFNGGFYEAAGAGALAKGDDKALGDLVSKLQGPSGDAMDQHQRGVLTQKLYGWQQSLLAKQDRAANQAEGEQRRRENAAVDVVNEALDINMKGGQLSPDLIARMTSASIGTQQETKTAAILASQRTVAGFASQSADQRYTVLERMRAARATPGIGADKMSEQLLDAITTIDAKLRAEAKENPWQASQKAGNTPDAQQFDTSNPSTATQVMQHRMGMIAQLEWWTGKKESPLQPGEASKIGEMISKMPIKQAATMLAGMGAGVGDADRVAALGKQMHDENDTLGEAMMYASSNTSEGRPTAELVLLGAQALKDNTAVVDEAKDTGWKATIAKALRGVYNNRQAENSYISSAFKIAAAKYAQNGSANLPEAIRLATGGIIERNGIKFPLPYGMKEDEFEKRLLAVAPAQLSLQATDSSVRVGGATMSVSDFLTALPKASLMHAGQGLYNVRAGNQLVSNAQGKPITFKVGP